MDLHIEVRPEASACNEGRPIMLNGRLFTNKPIPKIFSARVWWHASQDVLPIIILALSRLLRGMRRVPNVVMRICPKTINFHVPEETTLVRAPPRLPISDVASRLQ